MTDTALAKRAQRRRLAASGLTTCSVLVPERLTETFRRLALIAAALHRTQSTDDVARSITELVRITLPRVDLLDQALPEPTRRALAALRYDLGMTAATPPQAAAPAAVMPSPASVEPGTAMPAAEAPSPLPDQSATLARPRRSHGVPDGWKVERGGKPPTAAQAALATAIAWRYDLEIPPPALEDRKVVSAWIALHVEKWKREGGLKPPTDHVGPPFRVGA